MEISREEAISLMRDENAINERFNKAKKCDKTLKLIECFSTDGFNVIENVCLKSSMSPSQRCLFYKMMVVFNPSGPYYPTLLYLLAKNIQRIERSKSGKTPIPLSAIDFINMANVQNSN
jgi:hypothetical protein